MLNHMRTLLLGLKGPIDEDATLPGSVYVPVYQPPEMSETLHHIRGILFGSSPDYDGLLYRCTQYMRIMHVTPYKEYMTALDPRITYMFDATDLADASYGTQVTGKGLTINGDWTTAGANGRALTRWTVVGQGDPGLASSIIIVNDTTEETEEYATDAVKTLPGSTLVCAFDAPVESGQVWYITHRARIQPDLSTVWTQLKALDSDILTEVFGSAPLPEPYLSYYNLFKKSKFMPLSLAGFLYAYCYRLEYLRLKREHGRTA
jgi:hypothetical protein